MKIFGIDFGDKRIGLSVSDPLEIIASPIGTHKSVRMRDDIDAIAKIIKEHGAELIVIGLPLNMDGTEGERAEKTRSFGTVLEKVTNIPVEYKDERLTTVSAESILIESNMKREKRREVIDTLSAQIILQSYLDHKALLKTRNQKSNSN